MFGVGVGVRVGGFTASGGGGFDPDAQAFFDRVTTAGGTLSETEKNATNQLVLDMKTAGIWSSMKAVYPMVGASAAACAQNLKSSSFTGTFTSGWTFASTGVTGNGTSSYFNTGLQGQQVLNTTNSISIYMRAAPTTTPNFTYCGFYDGSGYTILGSTDGTNTYYTSYASSFGGITITRTGLLAGNYLSGTNKIFRNGVVQRTLSVSNTASTTTLPFYVGCFNNNGTASQFINTEFAFASIGDGLTDTQASNFYTAVQAFQTTLSRQV
jgi:hypothetical protein